MSWFSKHWSPLVSFDNWGFFMIDHKVLLDVVCAECLQLQRSKWKARLKVELAILSRLILSYLLIKFWIAAIDQPLNAMIVFRYNEILSTASRYRCTRCLYLLPKS